MNDWYAPRWRGQRGRLEVWYTTLTDPETGLGLWIHHELVASADGAARLQGWVTAFLPERAPVLGRFDSIPVPGPQTLRTSGGESGLPHMSAASGQLRGEAGPLRWDLRAEETGQPLFTFPKWVWERELLPAAQIVPAPSVTFTGTVHIGQEIITVRRARGAMARIYGHGNALRWGWLHADLGAGDVLEVVAAVSTRPLLRHLPPLPLVQLRIGGRDWPRDPLLAAPLLRARLDLPEWTVRGAVGRRRLRLDVYQDPAESITLQYDNPIGPGPVCVNTERASADLLVEHWTGRWSVERHYRLDGSAHAEIGSTTPITAPAPRAQSGASKAPDHGREDRS